MNFSTAEMQLAVCWRKFYCKKWAWNSLDIKSPEVFLSEKYPLNIYLTAACATIIIQGYPHSIYI